MKLENKVKLRKFDEHDILNKVRWINDPENNRFLHYDLPLEYEQTKNWFEKNKENKKRYDAVIDYNGEPIGLIGLLDIDLKNKKAEYYIIIGEAKYRGKGIAEKATDELLNYAFNELTLKKIYLYTEKENFSAQRLFERVGFKKEGLLACDLIYQERKIDRFVYGIKYSEYVKTDLLNETPIQKLELSINDNHFFIKRDDLIPFSFGGNKVRKACLFFNEIIEQKADIVVTYGSSASNHCRIVANMARKYKIECLIITPEENYCQTYNSELIRLFGAQIIKSPLDMVKETINDILDGLKKQGKNPYFIQGGGHGSIGTQAYVDAYNEIINYEKKHKLHFDFIFHASGTGTTQAGLICGKLINRQNHTIVGISIARKNPYGQKVVTESVEEYLKIKEISIDYFNRDIIFIDDYVETGYGAGNEEITQMIRTMLMSEGIALDTTYTGKAFYGMKKYIEKNKIKEKNILFIHTGGTPLFFDQMRRKQ